MNTLIDIYGPAIGVAEMKFGNHATLRATIAGIKRDHPSVDYFIKKSIVTNNLFGVDIMEEAVEIARLRLFLALVASAHSVEQLEPLPNIDFNLLAGNSLIGLTRVDETKFNQQLKLFGKTYRQVVDEKNRQVATYRSTATYAEDLRGLRDQIDTLRAKAAETLDQLLLDQFHELGIRYETATWDDRKQREGKGVKRTLTIDDIRALRPFHWGYEFDEIINTRGGFDAIITNPPWESLEPSAKEFFSQHSDVVTKNKLDIKDFEKELGKLLRNDDVRASWLAYLSDYNHLRLYFRSAPEYANQIPVINGKRQGKDINLYKLFLERCHQLLRRAGECGLVIPSGIYTDLGAKRLRELLFESTEITGLFAFENRREIFEGVHRSFKFVVLTFRRDGSTRDFPAAFMRLDVRDLASFPSAGDLRVSVDLIRRLSPDSLSLLEFKSPLDIEIAEKMIQWPLLGETIEGTWNVELHREFNMTDDAHLFHKARGKGMLPLYEGKMIWQFDAFYSEPRYWVREAEARSALGGSGVLEYQQYRLAYRDVAANTNERTMIAAMLPPGVLTGNTLVMCSSVSERELLYLTAVLDCFVFDWLIRMKVSAHCNMFYVYQMPVPRLRNGDVIFDQIVRRAARLTCTRDEFRDLAAAVGMEGDGATDEAERAQLRAEIDAIVAHLYGITETELRHMVEAFPLVAAETKQHVIDTYKSWQPPSDHPLARLIASGESSRLEFKSTARWDVRQSRANKDLEWVIVKTVAAFLNSEGGTLLIGVEDNGNILGLAADYQVFGSKGNADAFENWLMTLLTTSMGRDIARLLHISFHKIGDREICRVDVERSSHAVFVKDAQGTERLQIRAGNSTRELSISEALKYCRDHFEKRGGEMAAAETFPAAPRVTSQQMLDQAIAAKASRKAEFPTHGLFGRKQSAVADAPSATEPRRRLIDEWEIEDVLAIIRDVVSTADGIDREEAIRAIARELGAERTGSRIRDFIESALNTASRRFITESDDGLLRPRTRSIDDYDREFLKTALKNVVGRTWTDQDDAIRAATRWLGFRRTGHRIEEAFKSAIRGALRQDIMERDGERIRFVS